MTRQKTVFKSDELAHVWAHELAPCGSGGSRGAERFYGESYYSYATEIARIIEHRGKKAYLLNITSYSNTTCGHQSSVARAIPTDAIVFKIGGMTRGDSLVAITGAQLFSYALRQAAQDADKATRARSGKGGLLSAQVRWIESAKQINTFYSLRRKVDDKCVKRLQDRVAAHNRKRAKEEKARQAALVIENAENLRLWLAGERVQFPYSIDKIYLRTILDDGIDGGKKIMQTSRGVRIPLADAKRAFQFVMAHKEKLWERNGEHFMVGSYQINRVTKQGVIAGCHHILWEEIKRFATLQGWTK